MPRKTLRKRKEIETLLRSVITGDEKWIRYMNIVLERWKKRGGGLNHMETWKPRLTANKLMLPGWWDLKGIVYHEVLPPGLILTTIVNN